eukprot:TRINITY_DN55087_c0_g1_i1.p1 TRINITY_DN55087_c0_g1~~TRINITY_DN55087_c0_g1_i1.p1  ORF type:complete len:688 (-),score=82.20 TRINITY_DN55087_c0_g1_i1:15-2003(-)
MAPMGQTGAESNGHHQMSTAQRYLRTVAAALTGSLLKTPAPVGPNGAHEWDPHGGSVWRFDAAERRGGARVCAHCYTMVGDARLQHIGQMLGEVLAQRVPGDYLEAGAWRGGGGVFAQAVLRTLGTTNADSDRRVYLCDSFRGMPAATTDRDHDWWKELSVLRVSETDVAEHFRRFDLLDSRVNLKPGFFRYSLPTLRQELLAEERQLAVLRGDGDMYESYADLLYNLYDLVPVGGFFVCDDCPHIGEALSAVEEFRERHGITEAFRTIPGAFSGMYWKKERTVTVGYRSYVQWNRTRLNESVAQVRTLRGRLPPPHESAVSIHELLGDRQERLAAGKRLVRAFRDLGYAVVLGTRAAEVARQLMDEQTANCPTGSGLRWSASGVALTAAYDGHNFARPPCLSDDRRSEITELHTGLDAVARAVLRAIAELHVQLEGEEAASWLQDALESVGAKEGAGGQALLQSAALASELPRRSKKGRQQGERNGQSSTSSFTSRPQWTRQHPRRDPSWLRLVSESSGALRTRTPAAGRPSSWATVNALEGVAVIPGLRLAANVRTLIAASCYGAETPGAGSFVAPAAPGWPQPPESLPGPPPRFSWHLLYAARCGVELSGALLEAASNCSQEVEPSVPALRRAAGSEAIQDAACTQEEHDACCVVPRSL